MGLQRALHAHAAERSDQQQYRKRSPAPANENRGNQKQADRDPCCEGGNALRQQNAREKADGSHCQRTRVRLPANPAQHCIYRP